MSFGTPPLWRLNDLKVAIDVLCMPRNYVPWDEISGRRERIENALRNGIYVTNNGRKIHGRLSGKIDGVGVRRFTYCNSFTRGFSRQNGTIYEWYNGAPYLVGENGYSEHIQDLKRRGFVGIPHEHAVKF